MNSPDSQSTADGHAEAYQLTVELLGIVNYGKDYADVLCQLLYIP